MPENTTLHSHAARTKKTNTYEIRKQAVNLREQGLSSKQIAEIVQVDECTVRRWMRKYREYGMEGLQPYWREKQSARQLQENPRRSWLAKEEVFSAAYPVYAGTLESVASITRRYGFDYFSFKYHVEHYHPDLVRLRDALAKGQILPLGQDQSCRGRSQTIPNMDKSLKS